jgi:hypothetical protein
MEIYFRFMMANSEGCGWVLKAPFVTNSKHFMFYLTESEEIIRISYKRLLYYSIYDTPAKDEEQEGL